MSALPIESSICIIMHASLAGKEPSWRAKVSHSWLDHEIALVSPGTAVRRWQTKEWGRLSTVFNSFYATAVELGDGLMGFSSSMLVDKLSPFSILDSEARAALKQKLDELFLQQFDVPTLRADYLHRLSSLWQAVTAFREMVESESANPDSVRAGWVSVQQAGAELKQIFTDNRIPKGIVLP